MVRTSVSAAGSASGAGTSGSVSFADEVRRFVESARRTGERLPAVRLYRNIDDRVDDPLEVRRWLGGLDRARSCE